VVKISVFGVLAPKVTASFDSFDSFESVSLSVSLAPCTSGLEITTRASDIRRDRMKNFN